MYRSVRALLVSAVAAGALGMPAVALAEPAANAEAQTVAIDQAEAVEEPQVEGATGEDASQVVESFEDTGAVQEDAAPGADDDQMAALPDETEPSVEVLADDDQAGDLEVAEDDADDEATDGDPEQEAPDTSDYTGWVDAAGAPCTVDEAAGWLDEGVLARSKFFFDPHSDAWYWTEADGSVSRNHDAFVPLDNSVAGSAWENATDEWRSANGKWVRLGVDGAMVKGESTIGEDTWYFDETTGAMQYGFRLVTDDGNPRWVFYDYITGKMARGEAVIDGSHGDEAGWMYFDPQTGAVTYGWLEIPDGNGGTKWVYYDEGTGRMRYGSIMVEGTPYFLDPVTGARLGRDEQVRRLLEVCRSQNGITDGHRYQNAAIDAGSTFNYMGPCTAYVWWCFREAGLTYQFMDGAATTYPHDVRDWYTARGAFKAKGTYTPQPGDIWIVDNPGGRPFAGASATHAAIVDHVSADGVYIYCWEHVNGYVHLVAERYDHGTLVGYACPTYNG